MCRRQSRRCIYEKEWKGVGVRVVLLLLLTNRLSPVCPNHLNRTNLASVACFLPGEGSGGDWLLLLLQPYCCRTLPFFVSETGSPRYIPRGVRVRRCWCCAAAAICFFACLRLVYNQKTEPVPHCPPLSQPLLLNIFYFSPDATTCINSRLSSSTGTTNLVQHVREPTQAYRLLPVLLFCAGISRD